MKAWRLGLAAAGVLLAVFGVFRLITEIPVANLAVLVVWLACALIIHDAVVSPSVVGLGWLLRRRVPDRARRYLQLGLITGGLVTVVASPMIYLRGSQPAAKALLLRNYPANLLLILGAITVVSLLLYVIRVIRDHHGGSGFHALPESKGKH